MLQALYKSRNKKGFTLMEMLIVVAIIAILVAIAIPTFSSSLTKAKQATDKANVRNAIALATISYLADGESGDFYFKADGTLGNLESGKTEAPNDAYALQADYETGIIPKMEPKGTTGQAIKVTVTSNGDVAVSPIDRATK